MPSGLTQLRAAIPRTVWVLGFVSCFMDISSEMIHALLPLFLTTTLGVSVAVVGLIDGVAESSASIAKVFSGYLSDRMGRRKPLILMGYALGALSKPFFAMAGGPITVFSARFADRIGKGLRGAPRDALVADVTPPEIRGRAYGLRQALDTVGAFAGPLIAIALMALLANDMRAVFWLALIPGMLAVLCVILGVEDRRSDADHARPPIVMRDLKRLPKAFWSVVGLGIVFTLARFGEAFPDPAGQRRGIAADVGAARAGGDECCLFARCVSGGRSIRSVIRSHIVALRDRGPHSRRSDAGVRRWPCRRLCRCGALGRAHGADPGLSRNWSPITRRRSLEARRSASSISQPGSRC